MNANDDEKARNFLYMLKNSSSIDHSIISFYTTDVKGASMVKVGGYDEFCIKDPNEFKLMETQDNENWVLKSNWGRVGSNMNAPLF